MKVIGIRGPLFVGPDNTKHVPRTYFVLNEKEEVIFETKEGEGAEVAIQWAIDHSVRSLIDVFHDAERFVKDNYPNDLKDAYYFLNINPDEISREFFFRQYTHVVYCSGFRWAVVKEKWPQIQEAYYDFDYIKVNWNREQVKNAAKKIINHKAKINAILEMAATLSEWREEYFRSFIKLAEKNIDAFEGLPYIGKVTKYHLGICMGFNVVKPDVHIQRLADHYNLSPFEMCENLSKQTGYPRRIVDALLWRASEQGAINHG